MARSRSRWVTIIHSPIAASVAAVLAVVWLLSGFASETELQQLSDENLAANQMLNRQLNVF
jgi:flagellar basal body-associated protein FliL